MFDPAILGVVVGLAALFAAWAAIPVGNPGRGLAIFAGVVVLAGFVLVSCVSGVGRVLGSGVPFGVFGPTLSVSPHAATVGQGVTVTGSGFEANDAMTFRFQSNGVSWSVGGVAQTGAEGKFIDEVTLTLSQPCQMSDGLSGTLLAYYGQSEDMTRNQWGGGVPQPVAESDMITVSCS